MVTFEETMDNIAEVFEGVGVDIIKTITVVPWHRVETETRLKRLGLDVDQES